VEQRVVDRNSAGRDRRELNLPGLGQHGADLFGHLLEHPVGELGMDHGSARSSAVGDATPPVPEAGKASFSKIIILSY
jgi:hypothetical protein